ncbi:MAG: hypothetical protein JXR96_15410 [Deltaproteobacteria bacterium]|nr:hypothetical protein [Deltaproteobacteria bacterium]
MPDEPSEIPGIQEPLEVLSVWCMLSVAGVYLGDWLGTLSLGPVYARSSLLATTCAGGLLGLGMGAGQWCMLRRHLQRAWLWVPLSALGFAAMAALDGLAEPLKRLALLEMIVSAGIGALWGALGWIYLRRQLEHAVWWIAACAAAVFLQAHVGRVAVFFGATKWVLDGLYALVLSACTGYAMLLYLDRKPPEKERPEPLFRSLRPAEPRRRPRPPAGIGTDAAAPGTRAGRPARPAAQAAALSPGGGRTAGPAAQAPAAGLDLDAATPGTLAGRPARPAAHAAALSPGAGWPAGPAAQAPAAGLDPGAAAPSLGPDAAARAPSRGDPGLPPEMVLGKRRIPLEKTHEPGTLAAIFEFGLPRRPRRARLRVRYSGMSAATRKRYRQHAQLNEAVIMEFHPRGRTLDEQVEYVQAMPVEHFARANRVLFVSRSEGSPQADNPFRLHAASIEFDW